MKLAGMLHWCPWCWRGLSFWRGREDPASCRSTRSVIVAFVSSISPTPIPRLTSSLPRPHHRHVGASTGHLSSVARDMGMDLLHVAVLPSGMLRPVYGAEEAMLTNSFKLTVHQWTTDWYPMGKTSIESKWNIPGKPLSMPMQFLA